MNRERKIGISVIFFLLVFWQCGLAQKPGSKQALQKLQDAQNVFIDATRAEILENNKEALSLYQRSLELDPANPAAHFKIADILSRENKFTDALPHAKKANELETRNLYYALQLAQIQEAVNDWKGALKTYRRVVDDFEGTDFYLYSIAQLYLKNSKLKETIKTLNEAEKAMGASKEAFQLRQRIYLGQNDFDKAVEEGRRWQAAFPDDPEPYFSLAQLLMSNGRLDDAKTTLEQLLVRFPGFPAAHLLLAEVYINKRDEARADQEMEAAFRSPDLPIASKIDLVSTLLRGMNSDEETTRANRLSDLIVATHPDDPRGQMIRGDLLNRQNRKREARSAYLKAVAGEKNNYGLWEQIVLIDLNLNELDSVVAHTAIAKVLFPNTPSFQFYNGLANLMMKKYADAAESLEQAKRISLDNKEMQIEIHAQLGDAYHNLKEPEKSYRAFDEVLRLDSANAHVLNNYSYFLSLDKNNLDKALKMSSTLIRLYPEDPTYLDTHGWVLYMKKDYAAARAPLEKAAKASNSGVIWEHYGDVLYRLGKPAEAHEAWKKAEQLGGEISDTLDKKLKEKKIVD